MSHGKIRTDQTCQNCGHQVDHLYCSHCGQENTETRQPFYFLITHFIEDFVHYDNSLWHTIKNLFFKPGKITNEYLSGKRNSSVNPVKLYIFISFVTFFFIAIIPIKSSVDTNELTHSEKVEIPKQSKEDIKNSLDTLQTKGIISPYQKELIHDQVDQINTSQPVEELDFELLSKMEKAMDESAPFLTRFITKYKELKSNNVSHEEMYHAIVENSLKLIPKALFVYLPFFAFLLWIFYNKKRYWYFDHGIFTLHYFSILLLSVLSIYILMALSSVIEVSIIKSILSVAIFIITIYTLLNFILGLKSRYNQSWAKTLFKGILLIAINSVIFFTLIFAIVVYSYLHV